MRGRADGTYRVVGPNLLARPAEGEATWWQQLAILVALSWPDVAVADAAAAALYGLDSFEVDAVPLTVNVARSRTVRSGAAHRPSRRIDDHTVEGIVFPVVSATEAIIGIAGQRGLGQPWLTQLERVELAFESAARMGLVTHEELRRAVDDLPRNHPGRPVLREFLALRNPDDPPTESYLETRIVQVLRRFGITDLERQVAFADANGFIGRVDFFYCGVVLEGDGKKWHTKDESFENDRTRRSRLLALGHPVVEITSKRIESEAADVVRSIRTSVEMVHPSRTRAGIRAGGSENRAISA